ncbi:MAG: DegQ family serine endoprotease [Deltaproteobacteria bacterium]|nr:DegQ family serine endoprotease [Deltaproteobacteria bacterium]MBW1817490.1 DegQ family serine endoprotease [Deltaproteobacteria bacterium]MBW2283449.1 DegQ family serine endoprotease [Deltaproteobacteria bacterium]
MERKKHFVKTALMLLVVAAFLVSGFRTVTASKGESVRMIPESFSDLAEKARPSVVNIRVVKSVKAGGPVVHRFFGNPFGDRNPFEEFFGPGHRDRTPRNFKQQGMGSGFIIDREGYIVTNNHVVEKADEIKVKLADGEEFDATVVGRDPKTDLALIKIDGPNDLVPLTMGDSSRIRVGTWVIAVGSPFGLEQTVTAGIVSAKGRVIGAGPYDDFIQTDASINPGNSGGPLLNLEGEVVGINTAIMSRSGGNNGIGFAIPINMAEGIVSQLKSEGRVTRAWMGIGIQNLTPELAEYYKLEDRKGALVTEVYGGDPADRAGIKVNDIVIDVDGKTISSSRELSKTIADAEVGERIPVTFMRDGKEKTVGVKLTKRVDPDAPVTVGAGNSKGLGLQVAELTPETARRFGLPEDETGVLVTGVEPGGKADKAGVRKGDVIKEVDRKPVTTAKDIRTQVNRAEAGDKVRMLIKRANAGLLVKKVPV